MGKTTASTRVRVTERASPVPFAGAVTVAADGDHSVARGVVVCGLESANRRVYPAATLRKAVAKYEGRPVYLDHSDARNGRSVREWFGELRNVRSRPDGRPEADLYFPSSHAFAAEFKQRAEGFPRSLGLSHVAQCRTSRGSDGREVVEDIEDVESVDLVASPATNDSLYEHTEGRAVTTFRELLESLRPKLPAERQPAARKLLLLAEDDAAMGGMMDAPIDAPPADADPDDAIKAGVRSIVMSIVDDESLSADEKLKKIRLALQMHDKLNGTGTPSDGTSDTTTEPPAAESRKPVDAAAVLAECKAAKFTPSYEQGEHLRNIPDAATRAVVIESFKAAATARAGEPVRVAGRHEANGAGGGAGKRTTESAAPPTDGKGFAQWLKG